MAWNCKQPTTWWCDGNLTFTRVQFTSISCNTYLCNCSYEFAEVSLKVCFVLVMIILHHLKMGMTLSIHHTNSNSDGLLICMIHNVNKTVDLWKLLKSYESCYSRRRPLQKSLVNWTLEPISEKIIIISQHMKVSRHLEGSHFTMTH